MIKIIFYGIFLLLTPIFAIYGKNVPFNDQKDILDSLKDTASIIFAILGAWIAVIYPQDLQKILKVQTIAEKENELVFEKLIYSLILVTTVLIVMIISLPIINLIKNIDYFLKYKYILRSFLLVYIYIIALIQAHALFVTLMPNIKILFDILNSRHDRDFRKRNSPISKKDP